MQLLQRNKPAYQKWLIKLAGQDNSLIRKIAKIREFNSNYQS